VCRGCSIDPKTERTWRAGDLPCKKPAADSRMICFDKEQDLAIGDDRVLARNSAARNRTAGPEGLPRAACGGREGECVPDPPLMQTSHSSSRIVAFAGESL
jgi:hypothetical protein